MNLLEPGTILLDSYEIVSRPMLGGMGIVYIGFDKKRNIPVALKTIRHELIPNREAKERFLKEAVTWVSLGKHPNIFQCYEVARTRSEQDVYLVMELISKDEHKSDASLRAWLIPQKRLALDI